jgi:hypothetical protein
MLEDQSGLTGSILLSVLRKTEGKTEAAPDPGLAEIVSKSCKLKILGCKRFSWSRQYQ